MSDGALLADGFSEALIGMGTRFSYDVAVYDYEKCITPVFVTVGSKP